MKFAKMNPLKLINAFNARKKHADLSPQAVALYMAIWDYCNRLEWPESFEAKNIEFRAGANLAEKPFERARAELVQAEFITYTPKKLRNDNEGGAYSLLKIYQEDEGLSQDIQKDGQNKVQNVSNFEKKPAYNKNNNSIKQTERETAASGDFVSLAKSKFKAAFPSKSVENVYFLPLDFDVDLLIRRAKESPGWLLLNDALCDFQYCVKHYYEIIAGKYQDKSLFTQPRAAPAPPAVDPMQPLPGETEKEYYQRINKLLDGKKTSSLFP